MFTERLIRVIRAEACPVVVGVEVDVVVDVLAELVVAVDGLDVLGVARVDLFDVLELGRGVGVGGDAVGQAELGVGRHDHIVDRGDPQLQKVDED